MKLEDPCAATKIEIVPIADLEIIVGEPAQEFVDLQVTDTISQGNIDPLYCGGYEFSRQDTLSEVYIFDPISGTFYLKRLDDDVVKVEKRTIEIRVKMKNYNI